MFVEQSAGRIRCVRMLFVLGGFMPCMGLVTLALWRSSDTHSSTIRRGWEESLGVPLAIESVEHLRPGAIRLHGLDVLAPSGETVLSVHALDVEMSAGEVRLTLDRLECTPRAAALLAGLAGDWLRHPERFSRAWVVDVAAVEWSSDQSDQNGTHRSELPAIRRDILEVAQSGLHAECVSSDGVRAVRVRRQPEAADEVRVRLTGMSGVLGEGGAMAGSPERLEVSASIEEPLPLAIVAAVAGAWAQSPLPFGEGVFGSSARARGTVEAVRENHAWSGDLAGLVEQIDLAACTSGLACRASGEATVLIKKMRFDAGRLTAGDYHCSASAGRIGQDMLEGMKAHLGCRSGPAFVSLAREQVRNFDDASCSLQIDERGLVLRALGDRDGAIMRRHGLSILQEPSVAVVTERLAWLFSPPGLVPVPASAASAWILSIMPLPRGSRGF